MLEKNIELLKNIQYPLKLISDNHVIQEIDDNYDGLNLEPFFREIPPENLEPLNPMELPFSSRGDCAGEIYMVR